MDKLIEEIKTLIQGDVSKDPAIIMQYSHCASLFEVKPQMVVFPKNIQDVEKLINFVSEHKKDFPNLSLTARSAGTDMGGGCINDSIIMVFEKYFNKAPSINGNIATTQPGVYYRDFEKETLKHGLLFPSYPASREICAMGGILNNNSGGEKSLEYGKTENYVESLDVILADGKSYTLKALNKKELEEKLEKNDFEGKIYQKMYKLINDNYEVLKKAKPDVSKNSAGYYLWNVYDKTHNVFDLTKLFVGAQGTLGFMTQGKIKLVPVKKYSEMLVIFLNDIQLLGKIINDVLPLSPESFEVYDDNTLKLAIKFFPSFAKMLGAKNLFSIAWQFLPEFILMLKGGIPKLIMQIEFTGDNQTELDVKTNKLKDLIAPFRLSTRTCKTKQEAKKYWLIRRESFNLLRQKIKDKHTAPFIDDFVVKPEYLTKFLPELNKILAKYPKLIYTLAGHVGDGNFHIIPLMDTADKSQRDIIPILAKEVYDLILAYKGSITGEHNDGLIRTPYLKQMYGDHVYSLFEQTKKIFDPLNIFNPRKKVNGDLNFALTHIRMDW